MFARGCRFGEDNHGLLNGHFSVHLLGSTLNTQKIVYGAVVSHGGQGTGLFAALESGPITEEWAANIDLVSAMCYTSSFHARLESPS